MASSSSEAAVDSALRTADARTSPRKALRLWPFVVAVTLTLGVLAYGLTIYQDVPDPMPVHWNGALEADDWAPKSVLGFLAPSFIGLGVVALFWVIAALMPLATHADSDSDRDPAARRTTNVQLSLQPPTSKAAVADVLRMLEHLALSTSALIGTVAVFSWVGLPEWLSPWLLPVLLLAYFGLLFVDCARVMRGSRR